MTGVSSVNLSYTTDAIKYINGASVYNDTIISDVTGAFGAVPSNSAFMGIFYAGGQLLKKNPVLDDFGNAVVNAGGKAVTKRAGISGLVDTTSNIFTVLKNKDISNIVTSGKGLSGSLANGEMVELVKNLAKSGKSESEILSILKGAGNNADDIINVLRKETGQVAEPSKIAQLWGKFTKTSLGSSIVNSSLAQGIKKKATEFLSTTAVGKAVSSGAGKFSKMFKSTGAGTMVVIDGAIALITDVIPAFSQGGVGEGLKQTAKSGVKVAAGAAGWSVGATAGRTAGAWIGGAIGSIFPVVGTAIGTAVGTFLGDMIGGAIGMSVAGKITEKVVGKDYTDKVQEEATEQQALAVMQNSSSMNELNSYVYQLIQEDMADGKLSKDSKKMLQYLEQGAGNGIASGVTNLSYQTNGNTGLSQLAARVQAGDTSVYAVPDDILAASSYGIDAQTFSSYANNYTNFGYTNPYAAGANGANMNFYG